MTTFLAIMAVLSPLWPLLGVFVGSKLTEKASRQARQEERRWKLNEYRLAAYVEWMCGMEALLGSFASDGISSTSSGKYDRFATQKKLLLIEADPETRQLIKKVSDTIPEYGTPEYQELVQEAHSNDPTWDWPPFREKMNALEERVRQSIVELDVVGLGPTKAINGKLATRS